MALLAQMRGAQNEVGKRVDQRARKPAITVAPVQSDLAAFARELGDGWKQDEQRGIRRRRYERRKPVPRRPSMLDPYIPIIEEARRSSAFVRGRSSLPAGTACSRSIRRPSARPV